MRFATTLDGVRLAYWTAGKGWPLLWMPGLRSNVSNELQFGRRGMYESVAQHYRLIRYDARGRGVSDRDPADVTLHSMGLDVAAVLDDLGIEKAALYAPNHSGPVALAFAADHPERVSHVVLMNSFARAADYFSTPLMQAMLPLIERDWDLFSIIISQARLGWAGTSDARESAQFLQESITPAFFMRLVATQHDFDVTSRLVEVDAPTLVVHRPSTTQLDPATSGSLAAQIPGARLTILEPHPGETEAQNDERLVSEIRAFVHAPDAPASSGDSVLESPANVSLSRRELQALRLLALGYHNHDIARELDVSVHTVERHIANIYAKIDVHGRVEAAIYAFKQGLIQ